jgi:hypothetical protein
LEQARGPNLQKLKKQYIEIIVGKGRSFINWANKKKQYILLALATVKVITVITVMVTMTTMMNMGRRRRNRTTATTAE